jgi:hypothetical protein
MSISCFQEIDLQKNNEHDMTITIKKKLITNVSKYSIIVFNLVVLRQNTIFAKSFYI